MKLKRGTIHPTKNLIFWQYHYPFFKETNGEVWLTPEEFERRRYKHMISTRNYKKNNPLVYLISGTIARDKIKYNTPSSKLITYSYIRELIIKQNNKCYWFNVDMQLDSIKDSRNPLKMTIDRLDNSKGYEKDNVVLCCYAANCGRGNCNEENWIKIIKEIQDGLNNIK